MNAAVIDSKNSTRLRCRRHVACCLGPQGTRHRRNRNARPHANARGIQGATAAERRARRRFAAHDHPDRRADRNADGAWRRRALGIVQHLLDAGSRRRRHRRGRHAGVRVQGRIARRILGILAPHLRMAERRIRQHDPRRRRRRHVAADPGLEGRKGPLGDRQADQRRRSRAVQVDRVAPRRRPDVVFHAPRAHPGRDGRNHDGRASPVSDGEGRPPAVPGDQRERFGHEDRSSTTCTAAANRWSTASSAPPT